MSVSKPEKREELVDYALRKLGAPVLEINLADEQIEDLLDDAIQFFQEDIMMVLRKCTSSTNLLNKR